MIESIIEFFVVYWKLMVVIAIALFILFIASLPTISRWLIKADLYDKHNKNGGLF